MRGEAPLRASDRGDARRPRGARRPQRPVCSFRAQGARARGAERAQTPFRLSGKTAHAPNGAWAGRFGRGDSARRLRGAALERAPHSVAAFALSSLDKLHEGRGCQASGESDSPDILHAAYLKGSAVAASL